MSQWRGWWIGIQKSTDLLGYVETLDQNPHNIAWLHNMPLLCDMQWVESKNPETISEISDPNLITDRVILVKNISKLCQSTDLFALLKNLEANEII